MISKRYTIVRTSFGDLFITAEHDQIVRIGTEPPHISTAMRRDTMPVLQHSATALMRYLSGEKTTFGDDIPLHLLPFQREVFAAVRRIPYGKTASSQDIARAIGKPHAIRAVETVCRNNPLYIIVPCHRILLSADARPERMHRLLPDEALRRLEKRVLDKAAERR